MDEGQRVLLAILFDCGVNVFGVECRVDTFRDVFSLHA